MNIKFPLASAAGLIADLARAAILTALLDGRAHVAGELARASWQIDVQTLRRSRRHFARRCLDWTERRDHLAGGLGAAICQRLIEFGWIRRDPGSRIVYVSPSGRKQLEVLLSLSSAA